MDAKVLWSVALLGSLLVLFAVRFFFQRKIKHADAAAGFVLWQTFDNWCDFVLYPATLLALGPVKGLAVMVVFSLVVNLVYMAINKATDIDWTFIEGLRNTAWVKKLNAWKVKDIKDLHPIQLHTTNCNCPKFSVQSKALGMLLWVLNKAIGFLLSTMLGILVWLLNKVIGFLHWISNSSFGTRILNSPLGNWRVGRYAVFTSLSIKFDSFTATTFLYGKGVDFRTAKFWFVFLTSHLIANLVWTGGWEIIFATVKAVIS